MTLTVSRQASPIVAAAIDYVVANVAEGITLQDLARAAGMSRFGFCRRFHRDCGLPPMRWLWNFRTLLAAELIVLEPSWSLTDIAFACGFGSSAHFSRAFKGTFGKCPSHYRRDVALPGDAGILSNGLTFNKDDTVLRRAATAALVSA